MVERPTADDTFLAADICWPPVRFQLLRILEEALVRLYWLAHKGLAPVLLLVRHVPGCLSQDRALDVLILVRLSRSLGGRALNRFPKA